MKHKGDGQRDSSHSRPQAKRASDHGRTKSAAGRRAGDPGEPHPSPHRAKKSPRHESSLAGAPDRARKPGSDHPHRRARTDTAAAVKPAPRISQDAALMHRVAAGEEAAVTELYDRFASLVYRMAHQVLSNRGELEDVMQEVFVILWRTASRYDASRAALVTWVMLITRRRLVDRLRRRHRLDDWTRDASPPQSLAGDAVPEQDDEFDRLMQRVRALPDLQQVVLTRVYLHGQTLRQIGEQLKTPLGTVKTALSRGLSRLRAEVTEDLPAGSLPAVPRHGRRMLGEGSVNGFSHPVGDNNCRLTHQ